MIDETLDLQTFKEEVIKRKKELYWSLMRKLQQEELAILLSKPCPLTPRDRRRNAGCWNSSYIPRACENDPDDILKLITLYE